MSIPGIVFFLYIALHMAASAVIFSVTGDRNSKADIFAEKHLWKICSGGSALAAVLFLADLTGAVKMDGCGFIAVAEAAVFAVAWFSGRMKAQGKFSSSAKMLFRSFAVCTALEMFVFNAGSAHLLSGGYEFKSADISAAAYENFDTVSMQNVSGGNTVIEFSEIGFPVGTIYFDAYSDKKSSVYFNADITDDTSSAEYRRDIVSARVIRGNEYSKTAVCNFSGAVHSMRITFTADDDEKITLKNIYFNRPVMFHFSLIRFLVMFGAGLIVYSLTSGAFFFRKYSEIKRQTRTAAWIITIITVLSALFVTNMTRYGESENSLADDFRSEKGNQLTMELVDSFEHGRVDMMYSVSEEILALDNPYDWSQRKDTPGSYLWDHLLYNGKYYSYYGIAPVIVLFLPYHRLTGYYFPSVWAVFLFASLGIVFLTKFYLCLADRFFKNTSASLILSGLIIMQLSSGAVLCCSSALFYEAAQTVAFLCVTSGAYFLLSSNVLGEGKINLLRTAVSSVCLSLGVLSRPTAAVYCIAVLPVIYAGFRKIKSFSEGRKQNRRACVQYFACALIPYVLFGSVQMWYNYARFGNPFDFGIEYSLTVNDFIHSQYHTHFAAVGFWGYLFQLPAFTESFPFFRAEGIHLFSPQGYYFIATGSALGLLWKALPSAAYTYSLRAYRCSQNSSRLLYTVIIAAVCVVCPSVIIFSVWESGFAVRYCTDFAWQIITGALVICFVVYAGCAENTKIHLNRLMTASVMLSILMNTAQLWSYIKPEECFSVQWQANALSFARLFEFWK